MLLQGISRSIVTVSSGLTPTIRVILMTCVTEKLRYHVVIIFLSQFDNTFETADKTSVVQTQIRAQVSS